MSDLFAEVPFEGTKNYTYADSADLTIRSSGYFVGQIERDEATGKFYRWTQMATSLINSALTVGDVVNQQGAGTSSIPYLGTNDVSTGVDTTNPIGIGIAVGPCPTSTSTLTYQTWLQIGGYNAAVKVSTTTAAGYTLSPHSSTDQAALPLAGSTTSVDGIINSIFGRALTADSGGFCTAFLAFKT